jgi:hypothetical protein
MTWKSWQLHSVFTAQKEIMCVLMMIIKGSNAKSKEKITVFNAYMQKQITYIILY